MRYAAAVLLLLQSCGPATKPVEHEGRLPVAPGIALHYRVVGSGADTAIVLHGGPGLQARYLAPALDPLAVHRVLIYYDQRGRGQSDAVLDSTQLTATHDVEDLDSLRRAFGLSRVTLVGHHWGAILAALYAKRFPEHVKRLLLVSPSFPHASYLFWAATLLKQDRATASYLAALSAGADTADPHAFCTKFWGFLFSPTPVVTPELVHDFSGGMCDAQPGALRRSWQVNRLVAGSLHGLNLQDTLHAVRTPVLVIEGLADTASSAAARAWTEWAPDARELVLPGPGLFPWRGAEFRFQQAAEGFLEGR